MSKVIYNTASSLNGYIADENNSLNWLFEIDSPEMPDHNKFLENIGVLISGSTTYEWVLENEDLLQHPEKWPQFYGKKPYYVFTSRELLVPDGADVRFVNGSVQDHFQEIQTNSNNNDIWIVGGGDLAGQFFDAGLLDEIQISFTPASLEHGAPLLPRKISSKNLSLQSVNRYGEFAHLIYSVNNK